MMPGASRPSIQALDAQGWQTTQAPAIAVLVPTTHGVIPAALSLPQARHGKKKKTPFFFPPIPPPRGFFPKKKSPPPGGAPPPPAFGGGGAGRWVPPPAGS